MYVTSANLAAAFDRMLSEPKHKQRNEKLVYEFVVLNHILSANVATIISAQLTNEPIVYPPLLVRPIKRALFSLTESLRRLDSAMEKLIQENSRCSPNRAGFYARRSAVKRTSEFYPASQQRYRKIGGTGWKQKKIPSRKHD